MSYRKEYYKDELHKCLSSQNIAQIHSLILEGYMLRNGLYALPQAEFLSSSDIGIEDIAAHLLRPAFEFAAQKFFKDGRLEVDAIKCKPTEGGRNHYLVIEKNGYHIYLARVHSAEEQPKDRNYRSNFQPMENLFQEDNTIKEIFPFVVTYGDGGGLNYKFGRIGVTGPKAWMYSEELHPGPLMISREEQEKTLVEFSEMAMEKIKKGVNTDAERNAGK